MKKRKLIKSLLISAPIIVTPLLANSCNSKKDSGNKPIPATKINDNAKQITPASSLTPAATNAKYWVTPLAEELKAQLDSIKSAVTSAAAGNNTLDITPQVDTAKSEAKKIATFNPDNIDKIILTFKGTGNLKVAKNADNKYILTVYPSFIRASSTQQTLTTTLSLTLSDSNKNMQSITNTYTAAKNFRNYDTGLGSNDVNAVYASSDGARIYVGTDFGISVGIKQSGNGMYTFTNIITGLGNIRVNAIYASSDGNMIYVATREGFDIGVKQSSNKYTFTNYSTRNGLGSNEINSVITSSDGSIIYVGTGNGVSVGTKPSGSDRYTFTNSTEGLGNPFVYSIYLTNNSNTIYAGTLNGVSVGTKQTSSNKYTFTNYTVSDNPVENFVNSVYASPDGNTIYAGTEIVGVSVGTKQSGSDKYTFTNYTKGLGTDAVKAIFASSDGNTIYAGTSDGLSIGTKQSGSNTYTFTNLTTGLGNKDVTSVYASTNNDTIYAGMDGSGISISSSNWFLQSVVSQLTNNLSAITLSEKKW